MNVADLKLGKKLGVVEDPRTFRLAPLLERSDLPRIPPIWRMAGTLRSVPLFANDVYGCCTCASHGHRIMAQERSTQQHDTALTTSDILEAYTAVTGFQPSNSATDNGAYMLDVANHMRRVGMGREKDGTRHTIQAFVKVDHTNQQEIQTACALFGGVWVGVWLPLSAQAQTRPGSTWTVTTGATPAEQEPGSWGGHAITAVGFNPAGLVFYTWGFEQRMTWSFWHKYVDECYALISEDWFRRSGTTPRGFKHDQLERWLSELA